MPWTVAHQAPLSMGFSRQEYWSGLPCPPPGDLPSPEIKPASPALAGRFFTTEPPGKLSSFREELLTINFPGILLTRVIFVAFFQALVIFNNCPYFHQKVRQRALTWIKCEIIKIHRSVFCSNKVTLEGFPGKSSSQKIPSHDRKVGILGPTSHSPESGGGWKCT